MRVISFLMRLLSRPPAGFIVAFHLIQHIESEENCCEFPPPWLSISPAPSSRVNCIHEIACCAKQHARVSRRCGHKHHCWRYPGLSALRVHGPHRWAARSRRRCSCTI